MLLIINALSDGLSLYIPSTEYGFEIQNNCPSSRFTTNSTLSSRLKPLLSGCNSTSKYASPPVMDAMYGSDNYASDVIVITLE